MNKVLKIFMVVALVAAMAAPAFAGEFKYNGYYRTMMFSQIIKADFNDFVDENTFLSPEKPDEEGESRAWVDSRLRGKLTYSLNENVAIVYYGEVDIKWGAATGGTRGADGVQLQTKNVYADFKWDDTAIRLGTQGMKDTLYEGIAYFDDMTGISATQKFGDSALTLHYAKWDEGEREEDDDVNLYTAIGTHKFNENFNMGVGLHMLDDHSGEPAEDVELFIYGVNADYSVGNFNVNGFVVFQDGEVDAEAGDNTDISAWAASAKVRMKLENGDVGLRVIYFPEDDDDEDIETWQGFFGEYEFVNENQTLFLVDKYVMNAGKERYALEDAVEDGYGLLAFVLSGNHNLANDSYARWGLGYYMAADDNPDGGDWGEREGETLGYEATVRVGKKFFEKVDLSLNASYAGFGDFYDDMTLDEDGDLSDPDDIYKAYLMVNVPF